MFHRRITHRLQRDAVVPDLRAFAGTPPALLLLVQPVAVNEKPGHAQTTDKKTGMVERFTKNDHRTICSIGQSQNCPRASPAQSLVVPPQNDGLVYFENSRPQRHFAPSFGQTVQRLLNFNAGRPGRQAHHHRPRDRLLQNQQHHHETCCQTYGKLADRVSAPGEESRKPDERICGASNGIFGVVADS